MLGSLIFCWVSSFLILIGFSIYCAVSIKRAPKRNEIMGFRTKSALKNDDNWQFAQKLAGVIYLVLSLSLVVLQIIFLAIWLISDATNYHLGLILGYTPLIVFIVVALILMVIVEKKTKQYEQEVNKEREQANE